MKIDLIAFNCRYSHSCLALFYVRQELVRNLPDSTLSLRQFTINDPYYKTLLGITGGKADALFFSAYIWNADYLTRLLTDLNHIQPEKPIIVGGPEAPTLIRKLSFSPTIICGEIEGVGEAFYSNLMEGSLKKEYFADPATTFDSPYKQDDFINQLKNRNIYYESSRGCPFSCSYCLSSVKRGVVSKDVDLVTKELGSLLHHAPKVIRFVDRTFNADPARTIAIWEFLADQPQQTTTFHFEIAPDLFTEEMFTFLETLPQGLFQFEVGIQSTHQQTLEAVNRKMDLESSFHNIQRLVALNTIHLHLDLILGLPHDTEESFYASFRQVFSLQPHYIQMGLLKILPGTKVDKSRAAFGIIACEKPPYQIMATAWMDHETLARLYWFGECFEAFYNNRWFKTFFSFINKSEEDVVLFWQTLLDLCLEHNFFNQAKTQKLMCALLRQLAKAHPQKDILDELLIYDWLLCSHRFLPDFFVQNLNKYRNTLWSSMPESVPGLYDNKSRSEFFKRTVFYKFSGKMLLETGLSKTDDDGFVGFLNQQAPGVMKRCKTLLLPHSVPCE